jgi:lysozyme family protein
MNTDYPTCLTFTLQSEGTFVNNPHDPGGATMKGITLATFRNFKNDSSLDSSDLKNITNAEVSAIYSQNYWATNSCDSLNSGVDLMVFDMDVNCGDSRSAKLLQAAVGTAIDGAVGPATLAAANSIDSVKLINGLAAHQTAFYQSLSTFQYFGKGWINRIHARQAAALSLAANTHPIPVSMPLPVQPLQPAPIDEPPATFWIWLKSI